MTWFHSQEKSWFGLGGVSCERGKGLYIMTSHCIPLYPHTGGDIPMISPYWCLYCKYIPILVVKSRKFVWGWRSRNQEIKEAMAQQTLGFRTIFGCGSGSENQRKKAGQEI